MIAFLSAADYTMTFVALADRFGPVPSGQIIFCVNNSLQLIILICLEWYIKSCHKLITTFRVMNLSKKWGRIMRLFGLMFVGLAGYAISVKCNHSDTRDFINFMLSEMVAKQWLHSTNRNYYARPLWSKCIGLVSWLDSWPINIYQASHAGSN